MRKTWLILWLTMLCSAEAMAQSPSDKKWEFSIFAGGGGLAGDTFLTPVQGEGAHPVTLDVKGGYIYGFRITEQRRRHWGAELEYSFANHPSALVDLRPGSRRLDLDQRVHKISYSFLINPWRPRLWCDRLLCWERERRCSNWLVTRNSGPPPGVSI